MSGLFLSERVEFELNENYYGKDGINAYYRYPDVEVKMNYLQIPVKLGYNFHINDKTKSLFPMSDSMRRMVQCRWKRFADGGWR